MVSYTLDLKVEELEEVGVEVEAELADQLVGSPDDVLVLVAPRTAPDHGDVFLLQSPALRHIL